MVDNLTGSRHLETRRLHRMLTENLLPDVTWLFQQKDKEFKKKLLAELPRRTSDRIALKTVQKEEQVGYGAEQFLSSTRSVNILTSKAFISCYAQSAKVLHYCKFSKAMRRLLPWKLV